MRIALRRVALLAAIIGTLLSSKHARADAVAPPPLFCLPGQEGISTHYGPRCVPKAPTDCAPGYRGVQGGDCVLDPCASDQQCKDGRRCLQVDACQELRELKWRGRGWSQSGSPGYSRGVVALPQPEGPAPKAWIKLRICGQDGACNAPAECRPMGLCYPPDGDPKAKIVAAAPTPEVLPAGVYPSDLIAPTPPNSDVGHGGCRRGCAVSSTSDFASWLAIPLVIATGAWRRRGRAKLKAS